MPREECAEASGPWKPPEIRRLPPALEPARGRVGVRIAVHAFRVDQRDRLLELQRVEIPLSSLSFGDGQVALGHVDGRTQLTPVGLEDVELPPGHSGIVVRCGLETHLAPLAQST